MISVCFTIKGTAWSLDTQDRNDVSVFGMVSNLPGNFWGGFPTLKLFLFLSPHNQRGKPAGLYWGKGKKVQNK